jgi:hypothetical protein
MYEGSGIQELLVSYQFEWGCQDQMNLTTTLKGWTKLFYYTTFPKEVFYFYLTEFTITCFF